MPDKGTCSVAECDSPAAKRGMCNRHYIRLRRHGDVTVKNPKSAPGPELPRFWAKVDKSGECWVWTGAKAGGYGHFRTAAGAMVAAHRFAYQLENGAVPDGLELDHLCRNRACVRPAHLEAVSHRVNVLRGEGRAAHQARQTHCVKGHPFTPENTRIRVEGGRRCLTCEREATNRSWRKLHGKGLKYRS